MKSSHDPLQRHNHRQHTSQCQSTNCTNNINSKFTRQEVFSCCITAAEDLAVLDALCYWNCPVTGHRHESVTNIPTVNICIAYNTLYSYNTLRQCQSKSHGSNPSKQLALCHCTLVHIITDSSACKRCHT